MSFFPPRPARIVRRSTSGAPLSSGKKYVSEKTGGLFKTAHFSKLSPGFASPAHVSYREYLIYCGSLGASRVCVITNLK